MSHFSIAWLYDLTTNHLHCIPYGKKKQWFIEPFQGVFPPVPNLHFTGRCSVPLLSGHWQNAHIRMPHEYQTVLQCHICFGKKLIQLLSPLWVVALPSTLREGAVAPQWVCWSKFQVHLYISISFRPQPWVVSQVLSGAKPRATCFVLLLKTARQVLFSTCAMQ